MRAPKDAARMAIAEEAAEWYLRHREGPLAEVERQAFQTWMSESPVHVEEYLGVTRLIALLPEAGQDPDFAVEKLVARARAEEVADFGSRAPIRPGHFRAAPSRRVFLGRMGLVAASVLVFVGGLASWDWWKSQATRLDYSTEHGMVKTIALPDHSVLQLDSDSRVTVLYDRSVRRVDLLRGQAYFEVTPDHVRPFEVLIGAVHVRDVGTHFNVYRRASLVEVTTLEGAVSVETTSASAIATAGQQATVPLAGGAISLQNVNTEEAVAWRSGRLIFRQRPLLEVVDEFNRYSQVRIQLDSPDLTTMPVSGVISVQDVTSFMAFLNNLPGIKVTAASGYISVTRDK
jgi:transmembrane sensor